MIKKIQRSFARYFRAKSGATAIEYALIAALIAIAMLAGLRALGGGNGGLWTNIADNAVSAMQGN